MKTSYIATLGGPLIYGELPAPELTHETAKIKMLYCGINHLDTLIRRGKRPGIPRFPHVLGSEVMGVIEEIKSKKGEFKAGDTVAVYPWTFCGSCPQCKSDNEQICDTGGTFGRTRWGGYAESIVAPVHNLIKISDEIALDEASALILAGTTAQHLVQRSGVKQNASVLVTGATGGVGSIVIQLLKAMECTIVAATSHPEKSQKLKQLGVDYVIATRSMAKNTGTLFHDGVDVVIDIVGGETWTTALQTLAKNGTMVFCSTSRDEAGLVPIGAAFSRQWNILGSYGGSRKHLKTILAAHSKGLVKPILDSTFALKDAHLAHEKIESQKLFGKILLTP